MNTYLMQNGKLYKNSAGVALLVPQSEVPELATLFLRGGEVLSLRPAGASKLSVTIAYGVLKDKWRRLPIAVAAR